MENFFLEYRDPLFGLIVLITIILMVAILNYAWGVFSKKDDKENIEKFIKKFENIKNLSQEHLELLRNLNVNSDNLGILAAMMEKNGDFEKSIGIYLIALEKANSNKEKIYILTNLGKTYFKAGFLKRSEDVLLQSLKLSPRNKEALKLLVVIYEKLKDFNKALEVLDALREQDIDVFDEIDYIKIQLISNDNKLNFKEKITEILKLKYNFKLAKRFAIECFIKNCEPLDEFSEFPPLDECMDLIFNFKRAVNLQDNEYKALFCAKNIIKDNQKSKFFEINMLNLAKNSDLNATLKFKFTCNNCKNLLPLFFYRCPFCYTLQSVVITPELSEIKDEISQTF